MGKQEPSSPGVMIQFGKRLPGIDYLDRPGAYGLLFASDGRLAVINERGELHLPGGGVEEGESVEEALHREVYEEIGCRVAQALYLDSAAQYCFSLAYQSYFNKICTFFLIRGAQYAVNPQPERPIVWLAPTRARRELHHEAHRWAVQAALRQQ